MVIDKPRRCKEGAERTDPRRPGRLEHIWHRKGYSRQARCRALMLRTVLLCAALLAVGFALAPAASAEEVCVPKTNVCEETPPWVKDPRDIECWYYPETGDIVCYW